VDRVGGAGSWRADGELKAAARLSSLSSQMRPPINAMSREEMVSPRPVPPKRRVVEASACENASKMKADTLSITCAGSVRIGAPAHRLCESLPLGARSRS